MVLMGWIWQKNTFLENSFFILLNRKYEREKVKNMESYAIIIHICEFCEVFPLWPHCSWHFLPHCCPHLYSDHISMSVLNLHSIVAFSHEEFKYTLTIGWAPETPCTHPGCDRFRDGLLIYRSVRVPIFCPCLVLWFMAVCRSTCEVLRGQKKRLLEDSLGMWMFL